MFFLKEKKISKVTNFLQKLKKLKKKHKVTSASLNEPISK